MQTVFPLLFLLIAASHTFFLQSRDIRRVLRYFPKAFDVSPPTPRPQPLRTRYRDPEAIHHHDYNGDGYDRYDSGEPSRYTKNSKEKNRHYHCDHHDHRHKSKYPENRYENQSNKNTKYEDNEEYYDKSNERNSYQNKKKINSAHEKEDEKEVSTYKPENNKDKDYITGVLLTIPKIKGNENLETYFKDGKIRNVFFQEPLKTEGENYHHHHHHLPVDDELGFLY